MDELLERDSELARLAEAVELAYSGSGSLLVLEGPAGIGKTRLIEVALAQAAAGDMNVASAKASELERDFPFGVARQLLELPVASIPVQERDEVLAGPAGLGASALMDLGSTEAPHSAEASYSTLHGLYWLTANLAARKPLLIAVDDAHWADAPSLRFLAYLTRRIEGVPVLVVLVRRPAEPAADAEFLDEIATDPAADLVKLRPLSEAAVTKLVRAGLSEQAHESFCSACHRATRGNPFLLRELLRVASEEGISPTSQEAERVSDIAPETVARSVMRRLGQLPEPATALAWAVAILGDGAEPRLVAGLAGLDELTAAEQADALARIDVFRSGESMTFSHPIVREAIYSSLPPADRARAHRRAAQLVTEQHGDQDRVAAHLLASGPGGDSWATDVLRGAARGAVARGAPDAAATYLMRALAEPMGDETRVDLLVELGLAEIAALPPPAGIEHIRQALDLTDDSRKRALVSLELGRAHLGALQFTQATEVLERAILELDGAQRELRERLEAQLLSVAVMTRSGAGYARPRLSRLLDQLDAEEMADRALLANLATFAASTRAPAARGADLAERALAGGSLYSDRDPFPIVFAASALVFDDRLEAARQVWDDALAEARRRGSMIMFAYSSNFRSHVLWRLGSISMAEADARAALERTGVQQAPLGLPFAVMALADALVEQGELEAAERAFADYGIGGPIPDFLQLTFVLDSRARLRLARGRARDALDDLLECGRRLEGWSIRNPAMIPWRSSAALALTALGERGQALGLVREEVELAKRFDVPRELGIALRTKGAIEGRIEDLREAVDVLEHSPAALERARALTDLGAAVRRSGRRADAREPLRRGLELAQRCGAKALAKRAHTELLATGARPRRAALTGIDALTASERRVAEIAADGLSNREIAQALFVTEKTVEWHLSQAYRKLEIRSRSELATLMAGSRSPRW